MFKEHGDFTVTRQGNVLIAYVSGAWNAETEKAYGAIIHDSIKPFNGGPWVLISNVEEWELCTPDCQKLMMQLAVECRSKGLKREAIVNSNIDSVKLDLFDKSARQDVPKPSTDSFQRHFVATDQDAVRWLKGEGYKLE
ncbi:hypothetical protein [uncultured Paraglaciecola sp.]|uniref:hypothetical protein n=1 Tax=uncultured Paraglaciecola sp. TaxID=1765024 RepID=UPI0026268DFB|nr:hypothetical protein [uncultured Paraglaciecola sp.]